MSQVLDGLRVVDLSNTLSGTQASQLFADFGAEVVHVEPPGGSPLRSQPAYPFWARGKKSIELDLHDDGDRDVVYGLSCDADVLIETFRPGVADRLGLGYDALSEDNPALVYGSITAFGRDNALSHLKGYEGVVMAKIGGYNTLSNLTPRPGPSFGTVEYCSASASHTLAQGLLAALYERETSSLGQRVETTLVQGLAAHDTWNWIVRMIAKRYSDAFTSVPRVDEGRNVPNSPLAYRLMVGLSKDGRWLQFSQTSERLWVAFMRSLGLEWMLTDPKWKDATTSDDIDVRQEILGDDDQRGALEERGRMEPGVRRRPGRLRRDLPPRHRAAPPSAERPQPPSRRAHRSHVRHRHATGATGADGCDARGGRALGTRTRRARRRAARARAPGAPRSRRRRRPRSRRSPA